MSVNAHPRPEIDDRLPTARNDLGEALPRSVSNESLGGWGTAEVYHAVLAEQIAVSLSERNAGQSVSAQVDFRQLLHFRYSDGAKMLTIGGLVLDAGQQAHFNGCGFDEFDFFRGGSDPYTIVTPRLTMKEMRYLDSLLPSDSYSGLAEVGIPVGDADSYAQLYRYFPKFVDIEP